MTFDVGSTYPASFTVRDSNGNLANPSAATLTVTKPDQTTITPSVQLPPAVQGVLLGPFTLAQAGLHKMVWQTTSPTLTKTDYVNARNYISAVNLQDLRDFLADQGPDNDEMLRDIGAAATRVVEGVCGTVVQRSFTDEWVDGYSRHVIALQHGPLPSTASVTSLKSVYFAQGGPQWTNANGDFIVNPQAGTLRLAGQIDFWFGPWLATYTAGRVEVPEGIELGIKETAWDLWAIHRGVNRDQDYPDISESAAYEGQYQAIIPPGYRIPPRARMHLAGHERPGF